MPVILHLDMDSYFASVEQEHNQKLAGKPIGVIKAEGRTCVIAASREAKKFGVKTGTSVWDAKLLCPQIILVPAHFDLYLSTTKKFLKICENFSPYIEVFSIDELFMDITESQKFFGGVYNMCFEIKKQIKKELGQYITCSIGISYNRLLAKLASEKNKPNGIFEITSKNRDEVIFSARLTDMCGLGRGLEKKLLNMGIKNFKTLREIPISFLKASFGPHWSLHLKRLSYGEDETSVTGLADLTELKSVSRTFTLFENTSSEKKIKQTMKNLCDEVGSKLRTMNMATRQIGLTVKGEDLSYHLHQTFKYCLDDSGEIFKISWNLFCKMNWDRSVRFLGVWASLLENKNHLAFSIFPEERKKEKLWLAVDKINNKFGNFTIYSALLLGEELVRPEVTGYLGDKKYQFRDHQ